MRVVAGSNGAAKPGTALVESKGLAKFGKIGAGGWAMFFVIGIALDWFGLERAMVYKWGVGEQFTSN